MLDSFALIVLFLRQRGEDRVREFIQRAIDRGEKYFLSAINYGEVYYTLWQSNGEPAATYAMNEIVHLPIEIVDPPREQTLRAASLKTIGGVSYADCFAAALALEKDVPVLTGDPEFHRLELHSLKIEWLPPNR